MAGGPLHEGLSLENARGRVSVNAGQLVLGTDQG